MLFGWSVKKDLFTVVFCANILLLKDIFELIIYMCTVSQCDNNLLLKNITGLILLMGTGDYFYYNLFYFNVYVAVSKCI